MRERGGGGVERGHHNTARRDGDHINNNSPYQEGDHSDDHQDGVVDVVCDILGSRTRAKIRDLMLDLVNYTVRVMGL